MERRNFLSSAAAAAGLLAAGPNMASASGPSSSSSGAGQQSDGRKPEYYELRRYHMLNNSQQKPLNDFLRDAAIPAMNRRGIGPIGVFNVVYGPTTPTLFVLIPYKTLDAFVTAAHYLAEDTEFQKAGAPFLNASLTDPAYLRIDNSLLVAFAGMPKLEVPAAAAGNKPRIFELRIYESHSERAGKKKIEMFNEGGEIAIFRKTGLHPVFFGESLTGPNLPNLIYMLTFENMQARDKSWDTFREDPEWKKLSVNPVYKDTVSNITDIILRPAPYSQI